MEQAPVYYPTEEEFKDPLMFIQRICDEAKTYGICKVIPPPSWNPSFALDPHTFKFKTRKQRINELDGRTRMALEYIDSLEKFHSKHLGKSISYIPVVSGKPLNFYLLMKSVKDIGGYDKVNGMRRWGDVALDLGYMTELDEALNANLKYYYNRFVLPYEKFTSNKQGMKRKRQVEVEQPKMSLRARNSPRNTPEKTLRSSGMRNLKPKKEIPSRIFKTGEDCELCRLIDCGDDEDEKAVCHECGKAFHLDCLNPPLFATPEEAWNCPDCVKIDTEFGFEDGAEYNLLDFETMANSFKTEYFGRSLKDIAENDVIKEFWRLASSQSEHVEVEYGADIHSSITGSGFSTNENDPMSNHPWNLNNIPVLPKSLLSFIDAEISGMMVPWIYAGMCFSTFCWHTEDHFSYSINYLHHGEPKLWYGIPSSDAEKFEQVMRDDLPELFNDHPDVLYHITTLLSPSRLIERDVCVYTATQRSHEFIITFPKSYHAGFNLGFNVAEAVNFALPDWLPFGLESVLRLQRFHRLPVFAHDKLVMRIAKSFPVDSTDYQRWIKDQVEFICDRESKQRQSLLSRYPNINVVHDDMDDSLCSFCKSFLFLSKVCCDCKGGKTSCLLHLNQVCKCSSKKKTLLINKNVTIDLP